MKKYLFFMLCLGHVLQGFSQANEKIRLLKAEEVTEGDGAKVQRLIPQRKLKNLDPYVLFDDFSIQPTSGFPDHFHSGFEVVTYITAGKLEHKDSKGNHEVLEKGDVQCFTTGSGVVHSEMPQGKEEVRGFQIWINLPKEHKLIAPSYEVVRAKDIITTNINSEVSLRTIAAQGETISAKAEILIREISIKAGAKYKLVLPVGYQGFAYIMSGRAMIENTLCEKNNAVLFSTEMLEVNASEDLLILLVSGLPIGEPIRRKGSIVK